MLRRVATVSLLTYKRAMRQFGVLLPSHINSGIGIRLTYGKNATTGLVYPTRFLEEDQAQVNIAGKIKKKLSGQNKCKPIHYCKQLFSVSGFLSGIYQKYTRKVLLIGLNNSYFGYISCSNILSYNC